MSFLSLFFYAFTALDFKIRFLNVTFSGLVHAVPTLCIQNSIFNRRR
jgi:hypothetical protein